MPGETDYRAVGQPRNRALKSSHVKKLKKIYTAVGPTCVRICPEKGCPELDVLFFFSHFIYDNKLIYSS